MVSVEDYEDVENVSEIVNEFVFFHQKWYVCMFQVL
jgi:hypothetical protein